MTKPIKVEFAPGCFDNFDGTQEELDGLMAEIQAKFSSMTPEELKDQSRLISVDDLLEDESISDDEFEQILGALVQRGNRTLQ